MSEMDQGCSTCQQVDRRSSASVYEKPPDCCRLCSIAISTSRSYEGELCRTEDSPQARGEGVFRRGSTSVESSSNRPQNVAFYSCIQALFEKFVVPDGIQCLVSQPLHTAFTLKLFRFSFFSVPDIVMRRHSICRRRTKSIVVFCICI